MANVDPYVIEIPRLITNPDGSPSREFLQWLVYDNRWKFDSWIRSGAGSDLLEGIDSESIDDNSFSVGQVNGLHERIDEITSRLHEPPPILDLREFNSVIADTDYTALDRDFIKVSNSADITLPLNPDENGVIITVNTDGKKHSIFGNGRLISGSNTVEVVQQDTILYFYYFIADDSWIMSVSKPDNIEHQQSIEILLVDINRRLAFLSAQFEETHEPGLELNDTEV